MKEPLRNGKALFLFTVEIKTRIVYLFSRSDDHIPEYTIKLNQACEDEATFSVAVFSAAVFSAADAACLTS